MSKHTQAFRELQADLIKAQKDVAAAQKRVDTLLPLVKAYEAFLKAQGQQIGAVVATLPLVDHMAVKLPDDYKEAARAVLVASSTPLTVREVLERFAASGKPIKTTDPYRTMFKLLTRHQDLFENIGGKWRVRVAA